MDLKKRKRIRLQDYNYAQNGAYYVTMCAQNMEHIFGEIVETALPIHDPSSPVGATLCGRPNPSSQVTATLRGHLNAPDKLAEKWILELENKFENAEILKYVIMPNHIHMIILLSGDHVGSPLPRIINWFKTMTTNEYIRGVKLGLYPPFTKQIWQRSFYERVIRNEAEYLKFWNYIHQNPTRWADDEYNI